MGLLGLILGNISSVLSLQLQVLCVCICCATDVVEKEQNSSSCSQYRQACRVNLFLREFPYRIPITNFIKALKP